jgi:hypothetical protein
VGSLELLDIGEVVKLRHPDVEGREERVCVFKMRHDDNPRQVISKRFEKWNALQKVADTTLEKQGPALDVASETQRCRERCMRFDLPAAHRK